jgi:hypothetical protein
MLSNFGKINLVKSKLVNIHKLDFINRCQISSPISLRIKLSLPERITRYIIQVAKELICISKQVDKCLLSHLLYQIINIG